MYRISTKVKKLELKKRIVRTYLNAGLAVDETIDIGWFVLFEGSQESLFVGVDKPTDLDPGTEVEIIIQPILSRNTT